MQTAKNQTEANRLTAGVSMTLIEAILFGVFVFAWAGAMILDIRNASKKIAQPRAYGDTRRRAGKEIIP